MRDAGNIRCWIAPRDPRPGLPYGAQIVQAIAQSRAELLIFSRHANESRAVLGEIELAANRAKTIVPFRIDAVEPADVLEYYIRAVQWFDATRPPLEARVRELAALLHGVFDGNAKAAPGPVAKNNLPSQVTSFVGRETEVAEIAALLRAQRLVTLTGSGGVGKTRAALQVAENVLDDFAGGVWFVELAPLSTGEYIPAALAQAIGLLLAPDGDPIEQLVQALNGNETLVVFDNCEHLIEEAGDAIARLLRGCPRLKVLASSRQGLGIAGEQSYRVPSLAVPAESHGGSHSRHDAARYAAAALFVERAIAADRRFTLTDENAPAVAEICRRLDGIPLAIELAAARVKILTPQQLRDRLDERFRLLSGGSRDALPRQQTLAATIDWSYDLLEERERVLFRRLGIFVNGFSLEGAVAINEGEGLDELEIVDVLALLVDKSLVAVEQNGDALRYRLLESTRVYANEKLATAGERERVARRHLRFLRDLFVEARANYERTARGSDLAAALAREVDDVRAALDWAIAGPDAFLGGELLAATGAPWSRIGLSIEGSARIEAFLNELSARGDPNLLARLWIGSAWLAGHIGHTSSATDAAAEAVACARLSEDGETLAEALGLWSINLARLRRFDEADVALREAEAIPGVAARSRLRLLETRALLSRARGDHSAAAVAYERLRRENRALGNEFEERIVALQLAEVEHARGETSRACAIVDELLPALRTQTDRTALAVGLVNLAGYLVAIDELPRARRAAREAIGELAAREPESAYVAGAIEHLALALALAGDFSRAAVLAGYVDAAYRRNGLEREFTEGTTHDRLVLLLDVSLTPAELADRSTQGAALAADAAISLALE